MYRRRPLAVSLLAALVTAVVGLPGTAEAEPIEVPDLLAPIDSDDMVSCLELVPHAISLESVPTTLDVRILLDGVPRSTAEAAITSMRKAYTPLDITVAPTYQTVAFTSSDAAELNQAAKDLFGGVRPAGVDVVYTMTGKDITSESPTGDNVAGLADCIGGIRFDHRAFAVGEVIADGPGSLLGIPLPFPSLEATGKTMAHEIGHLLGGHHHYFSPEGLLADDANVASLMGPAVGIISLRFSTVNSLMVRAHMELHGDN